MPTRNDRSTPNDEDWVLARKGEPIDAEFEVVGRGLTLPAAPQPRHSGHATYEAAANPSQPTGQIADLEC